MKDTFSQENIIYGAITIVLINTVSFFTGFADILGSGNAYPLRLAISIGFPVCLIALAFFCGLKNKVYYKAYIIITLFLSLLLGLIGLWEVFRCISIASFAAVRNFTFYIIGDGAWRNYYHSHILGNAKSGLVVEIMYLAIMYLSYSVGGYVRKRRISAEVSE